MSNIQLYDIAQQFAFDAPVCDITALGQGFINDTYIVQTAMSRYILQRKNHNIFPDVPAMMDNIARVTAHLKAKVRAAGGNPEREVLTLIPTTEGALYYCEGENYWAASLYIEGSVTHDVASTPRLAYMGGRGIGRFQAMLADFTEPLAETIKGFHNIRWRLAQWDRTLAEDRAGRKDSVAKEIGWIESRRERMLAFWELVERGVLPMRITHNDTKLSNILFDGNDDVLCVIDLDTVMSSTSLNDFGDAIRSYTNTGAEDDTDLSRVSMNIETFRHYTAGYLSERSATMTASEREWLAFSALYITYEQTLRFLMDYLDGDTYYKISYPTHNLVRTHAQHALLTSMEHQYPEMQAIINDLM
ncbi:MAG: aminoglycoside phosphotransferase family protein [Alistipes sp.]|nr:aminoglycoside phosphotransferase family protein [Alistipes sp.]